MEMKEKALLSHKEWNGKLETVAKSKIHSREDLSIAYTPGVAEPCKEIAKDKEAAYTYTWKSNTVAVVSDGSAVLGLGNIGPYAAMPVMEGKCVLFKEFGNVNAVPICLYANNSISRLSSYLRIFLYTSLTKHSIFTLFTRRQSIVSATSAASAKSRCAINSFISSSLILYSYLSKVIRSLI